MRIVFLSKYINAGGAAIAARRLQLALHKQGVEVILLVDTGETDKDGVEIYANTPLKNYAAQARKFLGQGIIRTKLKDKKDQWIFHDGRFGAMVWEHPLVKQADIIHLHWINHSYVSLNGLQQLAALGKPIVWTTHDKWPLTGGCNIVRTCRNYLTGCGNCPYLKNANPADLSAKIFHKKQQVFDLGGFHFVTPTSLMQSELQDSPLLNNATITNIAHPLNADEFVPVDQTLARQHFNLNIESGKRLMLFGSMNAKDTDKGAHLLLEAMQLLRHRDKRITERLELLVIGKPNPAFQAETGFKVHNLGSLHGAENMINAYCAANLFITPSIEESFSLVTQESLACGRPVVAFKNVGPACIIEHQQNGYLAEHGSAEGLADGILWTLEQDPGAIAISARQMVIDRYNEERIARQYIDLYSSIL